MLDKAVQNSHELYFKYQESETIKEQTKIAFKWLRAEQYLGNESRFLNFIGNDFIDKAKENKDTYKPFLNYLNKLTNV